MVNVSKLQIGDVVQVNESNKSTHLEVGEKYLITGVGYSGWDGFNYADGTRIDESDIIRPKKITEVGKFNYHYFDLLT